MMKKLIFAVLLLYSISVFAKITKPRFNVLVLSEDDGHHAEYSKRAKVWLNQLALDSNFVIDYVQNPRNFTNDFLAKYKLIIQLDYPPYSWKPEEMEAFTTYITEGKGGWIGFHHATLLGDFDGYKMWPWFSEFMGGITFKNYIPDFVQGTVHVENKKHPLMKGVSDNFIIKKEEWYTYSKSPRENVTVLASVDESSYKPTSKIVMGDHPVIWVNEKVKARNVYIFMGHSPDLFNNSNYKTLFKNAIFWASKSNKNK